MSSAWLIIHGSLNSTRTMTSLCPIAVTMRLNMVWSMALCWVSISTKSNSDSATALFAARKSSPASVPTIACPAASFSRMLFANFSRLC